MIYVCNVYWNLCTVCVYYRTGTLVARYVFTMYVILYVCSLSMYNHLFRWLSLAAMATVAVEAIISYVCNILIYVKSTTNTRRFDLKHLLFHYNVTFSSVHVRFNFLFILLLKFVLFAELNDISNNIYLIHCYRSFSL